MPPSLLIANGISFAAAIFTARSSLARTTRSIYMNQVYQCLLLAAASVFFDSYAGIVSLLVCALRNWLAACGKLTGRMTMLCFLLVMVPGILLNNRGAVGWIVLAANGIYTLGVYVTRRELAIKCNILLNLTLWVIYECLILDIPSIIADGIGLAATVLGIVRMQTGKKKMHNKGAAEATE